MRKCQWLLRKKKQKKHKKRGDEADAKRVKKQLPGTIQNIKDEHSTAKKSQTHKA